MHVHKIARSLSLTDCVFELPGNSLLRGARYRARMRNVFGIETASSGEVVDLDEALGWSWLNTIYQLRGI